MLALGLAAVLGSAHCSKNTSINNGAGPCPEGPFKCDGQLLKRCNPDQTGYEAAETCAATARCDAPTGKCVASLTDGGVDKTCKFDDLNSKFDDCVFDP